jgi:hypothetical protein
MKFIIASIFFMLGLVSPLIYNDMLNRNLILVSPVIFVFVGYGVYRFKFKNRNSFKLHLYRILIYLKWFKNDFVTKMKSKPEDQEILPIQTKSIKLWKLLLRDNDSQISCSLTNRIRQIEKDNMLLILSPINQIDYQLTIMDVDSNKSCLYEIPIHSKWAENVIEVFDNENQRRMMSGQIDKRNSIHNDLDKLISQQQDSLKKRTPSKS